MSAHARHIKFGLEEALGLDSNLGDVGMEWFEEEIESSVDSFGSILFGSRKAIGVDIDDARRGINRIVAIGVGDDISRAIGDDSIGYGLASSLFLNVSESALCLRSDAQECK